MYDYYCVDCGKKLGGEDICFNLAKMLGLQGIQPKLTMVTFAELDALAGKEIDLYAYQPRKQPNGQRIAITLKQFLKIVGRNYIKEQLHGTISAEIEKHEIERAEQEAELYEYPEIGKMIEDLSAEEMSDAEREELTGWDESALKTSFAPQFIESVDDNNEESKNTGNYAAYIWIKPIFFEGEERKVYSLEYSTEINPSHMEQILEPRLIRGYCPHCGAPVVYGAGKYPHRLIGLLGAQSAGKTSIIISMLNEMQKHFEDYQMAYPDGYLCDSRYGTIDWNLRLFQKGWAVMKTPVKAGENTFNASILLNSNDDTEKEHAQIVTFIDIAGEMCYDWAKKTWSPDALKEFPLIAHCDIYLLCTCIDEDAYGEIDEDGKGQRIDADVVLKIAKGIYEKLPSPPPLCIVATKADLTGVAAGENKKTPFDEILSLNPEFFHRNEVIKMRDFYNTCLREAIRRPLEWCMTTYRQMAHMTYLSMMSCSALGGTRKQYAISSEDKQKMEEMGQEEKNMLLSEREIKQNEEKYGEAMGLDALWQWLLMVLGFKNFAIGDTINEEILPMNENYRLPYIPNYGDYYRTEQRVESDDHRLVFDISEALDRVRAVKRLFVNNSQQDDDIYEAYVSLENRLFWKATPRRRMKEVEKCADSWN